MKKLVLASMVAAAAVAAPAQAVTVMAEDGWTLGVGGSINQFAVFTENDNGDDIREVRDGLLPAFLNFDLKAPTMNGLDLAAHISFSPGTNSSSYDAFEQREVYFTVDGSFGQVLMGKALGLYGSHNILTEQTLFGVGYGTGGNGETTLGGIALGYDYAAWRSQIRYTTPDMNGFKAAFAVVDSSTPSFRLGANGGLPASSLDTGAGGSDTDDFRYEADLSYAGAFDGGSYSAWLSGAMEDRDDLAEDLQQWTVGGTLKVAGFEFMAQYSDSEDGTAATAASAVLDGTGTPVVTAASASEKLEWDQYVIQAGYRFAGTTLVSANYSELEDKSSSAVNGRDESERITLGVYHDVNSNLKLVAEYTKVENDDSDVLDQDIFAIGGFMFF
ncbi:porin [Methylophaga thiooxydans]|uniref:porin n=1 Tax=Methylophaga thiooxydans TaxID=392484 RepID=UPI002354EAF2|nr:porin [Methylophaga thiooxydans]